MKIVRWAAVAFTALMGLMNLPFIVDDGGIGLAKPVAALVTVLGVVGIVAAVGLARSAAWGAPLAVVVGALNVAGGVIALVNDWSGAPIGMTVGVLSFLLSLAVLQTRRVTAHAA